MADQVPEYESLAAAVRDLFGGGDGVASERPASGGCIAEGRTLVLESGNRLFVKSGLSHDLFAAECAGLSALREAGGVSVPAVLALSSPGTNGFLLMEYVEQGRKSTRTSEDLGRGLAQIHRSSWEHGFGFWRDNYIGRNPQENGALSSWPQFFAERRIRPQLELARRNGLIAGRVALHLESILKRIYELLPDGEPSSLCHGDLWGGNWLVGETGTPWLIDPAVYYGHREADLAMTRLFGGFDRVFYQAYEEVWPLQGGHGERTSLYNLYHLLNHANLFGGGYVSQAASVAARFA